MMLNAFKLSFSDKVLAFPLILGLLASSLSYGQKEMAPDRKRMLTVFNSIVQQFEDTYAPRDWKKKFNGFDLTEESRKIIIEIQTRENLSQSEFHTLLRKFFESFADYHVGIVFDSTESAKLPFIVLPFEDRFLVVEIDRIKAPKEKFPLQVGDELIALNGVLAPQWVSDYNALLGVKNSKDTDLFLASLALTNRRASRGIPVPKGFATIEYKRKGDTGVKEFQMPWEYVSEKLPEVGAKRLNVTSGEISTDTSLKTRVQNLLPRMEVPSMTGAKTVGDTSLFALGKKKSYIPRLGKVLWESQDSDIFDAYLGIDTNQKRFGVIRIPSYTPSDPALAIGEFSKWISKFEDQTEYLVIDQVNNPGGSVFYLYALASHFANKPLKTPKHRMVISPADVKEGLALIPELDKITNDEEAVKALGKEVSGYPVSYSFVLAAKMYFQFLLDEWNAGRRLSDPFHIWGVDQINSAAQVYTKPVLLVTNALDFSGGDFFPAILQDNKRARVFGTKTAGAGGYVLRYSVPNLLGISMFTVTESIAERLDLNPIENLGVTPDESYFWKAEDFQSSGFLEYGKAIASSAEKLVK